MPVVESIFTDSTIGATGIGSWTKGEVLFFRLTVGGCRPKYGSLLWEVTFVSFSIVRSTVSVGQVMEIIFQLAIMLLLL